MEFTTVPAEELKYRVPPTFDNVEDEREHRLRMLAATFRLFGKLGFDEGIAGHVTARDPEHPELFWVNPFAVHFSHIRKSDLILVDEHGKVVHGEYPVNAAAFAIHSQIHQRRPDVVAAAHTHSHFGRAWSTLGRKLDAITQDSCAFHDDHGLFDDYTGVVLELDESRKIAEALGPHKAAILRNHGLLTVGSTVESAAWWFVTMERTCQVQLMAEAAGDIVKIDGDQAAKTYGQVGPEFVGWLSFQPLYDMIVKEQPDCLE